MLFTRESFKFGYYLAKRDISSTYSRSLFGMSWLFVSPLVALAIYGFVYGRVLRVGWSDPTTGEALGFILPFFCGFAPYMLFSEALANATNALLSKRGLITTSKIPLISFIASTLLRTGFSAILQLCVLLSLSLFYQRFYYYTLPGFLIGFLILFIFITPISIIFAILAPFVADLKDTTRVIVRFAFYLTPIAYPLSLVSETFQKILFLNPLTSLVELFRFPIYSNPFVFQTWMISFLVICSLLWAVAAFLFSKLSPAVTDVL